MTLDQVSELVYGVLRTALLVSAPILLGATALGLLISIFQAATQINEQTLTFVPKIFVVLLTFAFLFPWMMRTILTFSNHAISSGVGRGNFP